MSRTALQRLATALALVAITCSTVALGLLGCSSDKADAKAEARAPKVVPWYAGFHWGWAPHRGPSAAMTATFAAGARIKLTCTEWMTKGGIVQGLGATNNGINHVDCPVVGRWAGKGRYTAHYGFIGRIYGPGHVWLPPLPNAEPSCKVSGGRKLLVCDDIRRSKWYSKKGTP